MPRTAHAVDVRSLAKSFGEVRALRGLSFSAPPGAVTGLLGPNGAGKTTALRCLLGLVRPSAGRAEIGGRRYAALPDPSAAVGASLDAGAAHPAWTGRRHLEIYRRAAGAPSRRTAEVLEEVGLTAAADRRIGGYSTGMRRRLALATALLGDPGVLVLDEPGNGLDPAGAAWLRGFLRARAAAGGTVLVSSHLLAEIAQTADRVVVMDRGRALAEGTLAEVAGDRGLEASFLALTETAASEVPQ
ncbi:ATP-binding cassette domain-containing protein [Nocardiopsis sp. CNT-189]|uniref:ABC transporter ATP-binding protein n=1 Tax=Nocardiopsis oceanisediminis TaxID=2816862 RepID=UPI003B35D3BC